MQRRRATCRSIAHNHAWDLWKFGKPGDSLRVTDRLEIGVERDARGPQGRGPEVGCPRAEEGRPEGTHGQSRRAQEGQQHWSTNGGDLLFFRFVIKQHIEEDVRCE